jgi:hypothetical protein
MHKNVTKCNKILSKWCKNKHGASKIMDTLETYQPLAAIIIIVFYLLLLYLLALSNTPENSFASIYSESLIKTACQHLLLLVGFDTLIYRKYYDTPPILVGHH